MGVRNRDDSFFFRLLLHLQDEEGSRPPRLQLQGVAVVLPDSLQEVLREQERQIVYEHKVCVGRRHSEIRNFVLKLCATAYFAASLTDGCGGAGRVL